MNTAACRQPLEIAFDHQNGDDGEGSGPWAEVNELLFQAAQQRTWYEFISFMRARGPLLRMRINEAMAELPPAEPRAADAPCEPTLAERLAEHGLDETSLEFIAHADRMLEHARDFGEELKPTRPEALHLCSLADADSWMNLFAKFLLIGVANGDIAADAPGIPHAVQLSVDSAREMYARLALATEVESQETDAA